MNSGVEMKRRASVRRRWKSSFSSPAGSDALDLPFEVEACGCEAVVGSVFGSANGSGEDVNTDGEVNEETKEDGRPDAVSVCFTSASEGGRSSDEYLSFDQRELEGEGW